MAEGFQVLVYTSDDPVLAKRLKEAGAASVMPAGSPIGSGQGVLNPNAIRICLEYLKEDDPDYPVIVDAGVGTASDVTTAMELGVDGVLLNTGIAHAKDPLQMARAMRLACQSGRLAYLAGRIPEEALRHRQQSDRGRDSAEVAAGSKCVNVKESPSPIAAPTPLADQVAHHGKQDGQDRCRSAGSPGLPARAVPEIGRLTGLPEKGGLYATAAQRNVLTRNVWMLIGC